MSTCIPEDNFGIVELLPVRWTFRQLCKIRSHLFFESLWIAAGKSDHQIRAGVMVAVEIADVVDRHDSPAR